MRHGLQRGAVRGEVLLTTRPTGCVPGAASAGALPPATGADRRPAGRPGRQRIAMSNAHLKAALGRIDGSHPFPEQRSMAFPTALHQIHPGVDHLVAERAFRSDLRKGLQHRSRKNDFAAAALAHPRATAVKASGTTHPPITPAHRRQRLASKHQSTFKMLPIEAMKQGQQGLQRHRAGG